MEWIADPGIWVGLVTLVALEIVLGVDNLIFIAILVGRLRPEVRERARRIGLVLALVMRLLLLAAISWLTTLTKPVFALFGYAFSWRDLILIGGGLFLIVKATTEIHERLEVRLPGHVAVRVAAAFWPVIAQIVVLDAVFSLDSVITAVGMVDELAVMMVAVVVAVGVMLVAAKPLSDFIATRPSLIILCLAFLLMVGLVLVVDGLGVHVPKGYVYAAIAFSVMIEMLHQIGERNRRRYAASIPPRRRAAHAILELIGGVPAPGPALAPVAMREGDKSSTAVFDPLEERMLRGVLELQRRPVTAVMTPRASVDWIDANAGRDAALAKLRSSPHPAYPVGRGSLDNLLGIVRKHDVLATLLKGEAIDLGKLCTEPVAVPSSARVLDAFELFKGTPIELAIVVDEYGGIEGVVTRTDLLEAIAGDLPDQPGEDPDVKELDDGALSFDGGLSITDLQQRLRLQSLPDGSYQTAAGMLLAILGQLPSVGDAVQWEGWRLEVVGMSGFGIKRLVARRVDS